MNIPNLPKLLASTIFTVGAASLSSGALLPVENFDNGVLGDPYNNIAFSAVGDTSYVSDLGSGGALRFGGGDSEPGSAGDLLGEDFFAEYGTFFGDALANMSDDQQDDFLTDIEPLLLDFLSEGSSLGLNLIHSDIFQVDAAALISFDHRLGVPLEGDEIFLFPESIGFYFVMNEFGDYNLSTFVSGLEWETIEFGVPGMTPLSPEVDHFMAIGTFSEFPVFDFGLASQSFFIQVQPVLPIGIDIDNVQTVTPVPEPSTYGLIGGAFLAAMIGLRHFKAKKALAA